VSSDPDITPRATYRLQLSAGFDFDRAAALADYLADLGVSHVYCSPCLQAVRGSTHGYDVVDPRRVSADLGGEEGFRRLREALDRRGLGIVLDIVPNHMAASPGENLLWRDVLENGPASQWAGFFDIDWDTPQPGLRGKVLLPVLGRPYDEVRQAGGIRLEFEGGRFVLRCEGLELPVSPQSLSAAMGPSPGPQDAARVNDDPARLADLVEAQHYRLACWREAGARINYRRFFTIAGLVGVRVEDPRVFQHVHALVLEWARAGLLAGLRVDHIDGLRDPAAYLGRLREACPDLWIVVEKILGADEQLPESWPVAGTTGYDFLNEVGGLFVDPAGEADVTAFYAEFTGESTNFAEIARRKKLDVLDASFAGEMDRLAGWLEEIARRQGVCADLGRCQFRDALREVIASLGVYRTYLRPGLPASRADAALLGAALQSARLHRGDLGAKVWEFLRDAVLLRWPGRPAEDLVARFQQLTGPVAAKGVEDCALYCFNRMVSLNEVGGDPARFGLDPGAFHKLCQDRHRRRPGAMLATSTHDTKRGEDVRARISVLSEIPRQWADAVQRWSAMNAPRRRNGAPSRNDEYLLYQTLVGAWPIDPDRLTAYMTKAAREAGVHTSWADPFAEYEDALRDFVAGTLGDRALVADLDAFLAPLLTPARVSSLSQTLIKCTAPGVPDFYQGTELWDLSLVDPDNRRAVDYERRRELLGRGMGVSPMRSTAVPAVCTTGVPPVCGEGVSPLRPEGILPSVASSSSSSSPSPSHPSAGETRTEEKGKTEETRGRDARDTRGQDALATHGRDGHATEEGLPKLFVIQRALSLRRRRPELFDAAADYHPLAAGGKKAEHVVAFVRGGGAITVAVRLSVRLGGDWAGTCLPLPTGQWTDEFTGASFTGEVPLETLLGRFVAALLVKEGV
jgi:(1->4)-alpha-D-glucan 1-alpha-D-glucosylmutase